MLPRCVVSELDDGEELVDIVVEYGLVEVWIVRDVLIISVDG